MQFLQSAVGAVVWIVLSGQTLQPPVTGPQTGEWDFASAITSGDQSINNKTELEPRQTQQRLERLAHLMDSSIRLPGGFRIGLDGIIGLIPGIGDAIGLLISSYLIGKAATIGASRLVLARMVGNVLLETALGSVPLVGDLFDFAFRANNKNMQLLQNHQMNATDTHKRSGWWLVLTMSVLLVIGAVIVRILWWLISSLYAVVF